MSLSYSFFCTVPKNMEDLVASELRSLGAKNVKETVAGVSFSGSLQTAYRICLWSRFANRVLLPIATAQVETTDQLYEAAFSIPWRDHLTVSDTFLVDCSLSDSAINHSHYAALVIKDAVADYFRKHCGRRPNVETINPDLRLNAHINRNECVISIDLSGDSLHRRGYRQIGGKATLKENVAAAVLTRAGWPHIASQGGSFIDPMCGSGTLPIEAAFIAFNIAPGLYRKYYGFIRWRGHDSIAWNALLKEARDSAHDGMKRSILILGSDQDSQAIESARSNLSHTGLTNHVRFEVRNLADLIPPKESTPGLIAVDPPYGERLGDMKTLLPVYEMMGQIFSQHFNGWKGAVLTSETELAHGLGLRACRINKLFNGPIACTLVHLNLDSSNHFSPKKEKSILHTEMNNVPKHITESRVAASPGALSIANRLRKNLKHLQRWANRENIYCYRIYDADLPEYAIAIDLFENRWIHVQEYTPPASIDSEKAAGRIRDVHGILMELLHIQPEAIFFKQRRRQKGSQQYQKLSDRGTFFEVRESDCLFLVNFTDYLDTGLFLDHRNIRNMLRSMASKRHFLNLFAYTGSASVYAAKGEALSTTSVDLSSAYTRWAEKNFLRNGITGKNHRIFQSDCIEWLKKDPMQYGLIFIDPPTFSNSKQTANDFDLQKDHPYLIKAAMDHLTNDGYVIFSNNYRRFKLDPALGEKYEIRNLTRTTIPEDFKRNPRIHSCYQLRHKQ